MYLFMTKKRAATVILLVLVIAAVIGVIVFELDSFDVIDLDYKPQYLNIAYEDLGSAKKLEGRTALVTVFASDSNGKWDMTDPADAKKRDDMLGYLSVGTKWLAEQGKRYGKELEFCIPEGSNKEYLYFEHDFGDIFVNENWQQRFLGKNGDHEWEFIDSTVDNSAIHDKLGCENIVYYFLYNYGESPNLAYYELNVYDKPFERPYELVVSPYLDGVRNTPVTPELLIHEMLHDFGTPDLYAPDNGGILYRTSEEYNKYCGMFRKNDIMYITGGDRKRTAPYDCIDSEITDITAYYLGWIKDPPLEVDFFRLVRSQHDRP